MISFVVAYVLVVSGAGRDKENHMAKYDYEKS